MVPTNSIQPRFCLIVLASLSASLLLLAGCTATNSPIVSEALPVVSATSVALADQNEQVLRVTISDGKFDANVYSEQAGATRMLVISTAGPYLFEIDNLVDRRELPAYGGSVIDYDVSQTGDFTMRAYPSTVDGTGSAPATATLRITPVGE